MKKVDLKYRVIQTGFIVSTTAVEAWCENQKVCWYECWCDCETESIKCFNADNHLQENLLNCLSEFDRKSESAIDMIIADIQNRGYQVDQDKSQTITDYMLWNPKEGNVE